MTLTDSVGEAFAQLTHGAVVSVVLGFGEEFAEPVGDAAGAEVAEEGDGGVGGGGGSFVFPLDEAGAGEADMVEGPSLPVT
jgi:hypothetical protein